ncbi:MAG TPA: HEAT repeat domain-containing protein [Alphaproteobacteria bacterium]|nr:HEAT repeat domain-containing protein [Alphaproteobacteria bacterium]
MPLRICLAAALFWTPSPPAFANGWEWHSIPREALIAGLESQGAEARSYAIRALGFRGDKLITPRLIEIAASNDEPTALRSEATRALARIKDRRAVTPLIELLRAGPIPELRGLAAAALGQIGGEQALQALLATFDMEQGLLARTELIAALGQFSDPRSIAALSRELEQAKSPNLRRRAALALGETGHPAAAGPLVEALGRPQNKSFKIYLVDAMGRSGGADARRPLAELAEAADDPLLRIRATIALGAVTEGRSTAALIKLLRDPNPAIRYHVIQGLAKQADPAARPALIEVYREIQSAPATDPEDILFALTMRYEIVRTLTAIDPTGAAAILRNAAERLEFGRNSAFSLRLNEGAYELRRVAIWGLGYSDSDQSSAYLLKTALADRDFRIRSVTARSLGVLGRTAAVPALIDRLGDKVAEVRWQAALVLGRLGDVRAAEALIAALEDGHPEVRRQAALALGYLGAKNAVQALRARAGTDADERVREAAGQGLALITK